MAHTEKSQKLDMLLALAMAGDKLSKPASSGPSSSRKCPDAETIACYFDQQLSESEKQQFFRQLAECPASYSQWIGMAETLGYGLDKKIAIQSSESLSWFEQLKVWFGSYQKLAAAVVVVGVAFLVILNLNSPPLSLQQQMADNWEKHRKLYVAQMDVAEYLTRRQTKSTLIVVPFADKTAFSNGFRKGLKQLEQQNNQASASLIANLPEQNLACDSTRCEQQTPINEQLGTWSALVLQQCQQHSQQKSQQKGQQNNQADNLDYWQGQQSIYQKFNQEYKTLEQRYGASELGASSLNRRLQKMQRAFAQLPAQIQPVCDGLNQLTLYALQK